MMRCDIAMDDLGLRTPDRPTCIVLERHGSWAAALRRADGSPSYKLRETRGFAEVNQALSTQSRSLVAIEIRVEAFQQTIEGIDRLLQEFPRIRCIVLANRVPATMALVAWEAGAVAVINSPRQIGRVVDIVQQWVSAVRALPTPQADDEGADDEGIAKHIPARLPFRAIDPSRTLPKPTRRKPPTDEDDEPIEFEPLP